MRWSKLFGINWNRWSFDGIRHWVLLMLCCDLGFWCRWCLMWSSQMGAGDYNGDFLGIQVLCKAQAIPMHLSVKSRFCMLHFMCSCSLSYSCSNFNVEFIAFSLSGILNSSVTHLLLQFPPKTCSIWIHTFIYWEMFYAIETYGYNFAVSIVVKYCHFPRMLLTRCSVHALLLIWHLPMRKPILIAKLIKKQKKQTLSS